MRKATNSAGPRDEGNPGDRTHRHAPAGPDPNAEELELLRAEIRAAEQYQSLELQTFGYTAGGERGPAGSKREGGGAGKDAEARSRSSPPRRSAGGAAGDEEATRAGPAAGGGEDAETRQIPATDTSFSKTTTLQFDTDALRQEGLDPALLRPQPGAKKRRSRRRGPAGDGGDGGAPT